MKDSERGREEEKGSLFAERSRRIRECVLERIDFLRKSVMKEFWS